jgi:hypothetical protein
MIAARPQSTAFYPGFIIGAIRFEDCPNRIMQITALAVKNLHRKI